MASNDDETPMLGACAICEKSASLRCAGCRKRFYCSKEHQRGDWARHKLACRSWEIRENEELGRHLIASRDLETGDFIVAETPIVWGPAPHGDSIVCVGCGDSKVRVRCPGCNWYACRVSCDGLVDENRHGIECAFLTKSGMIPRRRNPKLWAILGALQSHEESRGVGTEAYEETELVARQIDAVLAMDPSSREILPKICGLIDVNALETNPPEGCAALYETACLLEHNCVANTRHSFSIDAQGRPKITVTAATSIKKGEHLSTMYTHALWSTRSRREHLMVTKYFSCRCDRCTDPTELGSHLGTLKCLCGSGLVLPNNPLDNETEWTCTVCPGSLTASEVAQLTDRLADDVDAAMGMARKDSLSDLLSRLSVLLHPGHQHCTAVGHSLMQLLSPEDPKKAQICRQIIETTSILDPYGIRLCLYTAVALRELASCPGQDRKALLERARSLLSHEPPNTPGQEVLRLVQNELTN
ncbi:SET domain-containing protein SmydA-8-like isoform X2 [Venturia canescens]|uniref:SET domain-containing protein SmydA-8-like isoform X2 n=1 Tax=Venturia canescens TaxID=32260 RepID=UPI001C9BFF40|nr:SET domain-containing protein SmydA-8-like isoform X2 [Venturia canescens]